MTRFVTDDGVDCQCIAAKYIGSAQSTGLAVGTAAFVHAMALNTFVGFETPPVVNSSVRHPVYSLSDLIQKIYSGA